MALSIIAGLALFGLKVYAYLITGSLAIYSDALESVIHLFAVGFSAFSLSLSMKPADHNHPYGHDRIAFFSAGFEGAAITAAACLILYESIKKLIFGFEIEQLEQGIYFITIATVVNGILGLYLIRVGKKHQSLIIRANGMHLLTDCWTSLAVIVALILVNTTGIIYFDPLVAIGAAINIVWTGAILIKGSAFGLMDTQDETLDKQLRKLLDEETKALKVSYHALRHRMTGSRALIEFHLLFPDKTSLADAHEVATKIESHISQKIESPTEILTHLEPKETHDLVHKRYHTGY